MIDVFLVIGLILFAGFLANLIFEKIKISQVLILISLGFLIGPVLGFASASNGSVIGQLSSFIGSLALIILLFDGGISINVFELANVLSKSTLFTVIVFLLSMFVTALITVSLMGWTLLEGLLLGASLGGTSFAIVLSLIKGLNISNDSKLLLTLESTLTDALCIVFAFGILQIIISKSTVGALSIFNLLASAFSVAIVAGVIGAILWTLALRKLDSKQFPYMLTLATVFVLYSLVNSIGGNGGISVFVFGIILANIDRLAKVFGTNEDYAINNKINRIQDEVTFFTRTFFFVFLGLILSPSGITSVILVAGLSLSLLFVIVRYGIGKLMVKKEDLSAITSMVPRGLAAAVLAGLPAASGVIIPGFVELSIIVIIITNIFATVGMYAISNKGNNTPETQDLPQEDTTAPTT